MKMSICLILLIFEFMTSYKFVQSVDLNSIIPRTVCYSNEHDNCNVRLIDAYPEYSMSITNLTEADTYFWLFTRRNVEAPEPLHRCAGKLPPDSNFNPEKDLIMVLTPFITGFCDVAVYREQVLQFLKRDDYNVIAVDFAWGNHLDYGTVVKNLKIVANQAAIVLNNIQKQTGMKNDQLVLCGHSLGAHTAGLISKRFRARRIIGLDPAGPAFDKYKTPVEDRLDVSDADLVEVWHTNAGRCLTNFGTIYDYGHVNFYINGGSVQTSCRKYLFESLLKGDIIYVLNTLPSFTCYHSQSTQYFKVSINPGSCQFVGVKCPSYADFKAGKCTCGETGEDCLIMGFDTEKFITEDSTSPQKYYVETTDDCPYCDNSNIKLEGYEETYKESIGEGKYNDK